MDSASHIRDAAIFQDISHDAVQRLCSCGELLTFKPGHRLFDRGQEARELMILNEGVVELFFPLHIMGVTRELTFESKQPGEIVAWSSLVSPYHFTLSARCAGDCSLTCLDRPALQTFFDHDPRTGYLFMRNLAAVIGRRLQAMQDMWIYELQCRAGERLE